MTSKGIPTYTKRGVKKKYDQYLEKYMAENGLTMKDIDADSGTTAETRKRMGSVRNSKLRLPR